MMINPKLRLATFKCVAVSHITTAQERIPHMLFIATYYRAISSNFPFISGAESHLLIC